MTCTIMVSVPKGRTAAEVAEMVREKIRPKVYDYSLVGYRQLNFTVAERGKEVHMTVHNTNSREEMTVFGQVKDSLYSHQLECTFQASMANAA